jgi:hypothetical protein
MFAAISAGADVGMSNSLRRIDAPRSTRSSAAALRVEEVAFESVRSSVRAAHADGALLFLKSQFRRGVDSFGTAGLPAFTVNGKAGISSKRNGIRFTVYGLRLERNVREWTVYGLR